MLTTTLCYLEFQGKFLMLHRTKKKQDMNAGKWIGVGGKAEPGETAEECVVREVWEETGLTLTEYERIGIVKFCSDSFVEDMYVFRGISFTGQLNEDCPEGELAWIPMENVAELPTWEGDRYFLKAVLEKRKNINMTLRYEGEHLVEVREESGAVEVETSSLLRAEHGFSTRAGGVSEGIYHSLNLGKNRGDIPERVNENWRRFLESCKIPERKLVWGKQVHGSHVAVVGKEHRLPYGNPVARMEADGFVTDEPEVPLVVFTADCVPVLLEDSVHGVIGAVHSGWRSTVADIEGEAVKKMTGLGAEVKTICVAIGPAIDRCCFEVGAEVIKEVQNLLGETAAKQYYYTVKQQNFNQKEKHHPMKPRIASEEKQDAAETAEDFAADQPEEKFHLDLRGVIAERLCQLGVPKENIELVGGCTMCNHERYWSHRYTKEERGSLAAVIRMDAEIKKGEKP